MIECVEKPAAKVRITVYASLFKFDRFEWLVEKATELGVEAIVPVVATRSDEGLDPRRKPVQARPRLAGDVFLQGEPKVEALFPLFSGENIADVTIENIALDGNKANNGNLDGNYAGCIWMQDCNRITMRKVTARNYNGDGISWQICHDVLVEDCHSHDHTGLGLHPGSGSQRTIIRRNRMVGNEQGLFFCWGVRWGLAENNYIEGSSSTAFRSGTTIPTTSSATTKSGRAEKSGSCSEKSRDVISR